jgi:hypothetical protein
VSECEAGGMSVYFERTAGLTRKIVSCGSIGFFYHLLWLFSDSSSRASDDRNTCQLLSGSAYIL